MIIPIRCFTCGKVLADKWQKYVDDVTSGENQSQSQSQSKPEVPAIIRISDATADLQMSRHGTVLDRLGVTRMCCRRHFLTNVDILDKI